jgi:hypothetical protein
MDNPEDMFLRPGHQVNRQLMTSAKTKHTIIGFSSRACGTTMAMNIP